jgi:hypothetical protein
MILRRVELQAEEAMMNERPDRDTGRLALVAGTVAVGSAVSLATYFAVQGPFGTINDLGNAATGVLSGWLAWRLRPHMPERSRLVVGAALAGAAITVIGSTLVVSGTTGWFLAGLVSSVGFAGIGVCLVAVNRARGATAAWQQRLRTLGIAAGAMMAVGVAAVPAIVLRLDDPETAPAWAWISSIGWLGTYVVFPAWAIWLGVIETRSAGRAMRLARATEPLPAANSAERIGGR